MANYAYVRISHKESAKRGVSEADQIRVISSYMVSVSAYHAKVKCPDDVPDGFFVDRGVSGWSKDINERDAGLRLIQTLKPGDHVFFYSVDRAFRNTRNFLTWLKRWAEIGVTPHFVNERLDFSTAGGMFVATILAAAAQYYSDIISERTSEALRIRSLKNGRKPKPKRPRSEWAQSEVIGSKKPEVTSAFPFNVHVYNRVSTYDQQLSGLGMEVQREANRRVAESIGGVSVQTYEDESVSAFSVPFTSRPGASQLLSTIADGDHIVLYRTDRAFRNLREACEFESKCRERGITIHLTRDGIRTDNEYGRMFFSILAMFSELESSIKRRRKLEQNEWLRSNGRPSGTALRHHKVIRVGSKKKVVHDMQAIQDHFTVWVLRESGLTWPDVTAYLNAIQAARNNLVPVLRGLDKSRRKKKRKSTPTYWRQCSVDTVRCLYNAARTTVLDELPVELQKDFVSAAIEIVRTPLEQRFMRLCYRCQGEFPMADIEDRLASRATDEKLRCLLPARPLCSTSQA